MMVERRFGDAGARIVIEEFMRGQEASVFALTDGRRAVLLPTAQDHKRAFDGDAGPNTGGMGAFAPSPLVDDQMLDRIRDTIILPVIDGMREEGREFRGFLYAGLMLTAEGPKVVEFNVRMGDPEAQVVLPMIDGDLAPLLRDAAAGELRSGHVPGARLASRRRRDRVGGVSGQVRDGQSRSAASGRPAPFPGWWSSTPAPPGAGPTIVTAGGRVLTVVAEGQDYRQAISRAYDAAQRIAFDGAFMRKDIGRKALTAV